MKAPVQSLYWSCECWAGAFLALALSNVAEGFDWDLAALVLRVVAPIVALGALALEIRATQQLGKLAGTITLTLPARLP